MVSFQLSDLYVGNFDFGKLLAVPALAPVVSPALELEHDDLFGLAVAYDFRNHLGTLHHRLTGSHLFAVTRE
jgi:hypothetical protein